MLGAFLSKPRLKTIWTMSHLMSYDCVEKLVIGKRSLNSMLTGCLSFKILEHSNGRSSFDRSMGGLVEGV